MRSTTVPSAVPPGKILFLDRYEAGDARISRIVDTDGDVRHEPVPLSSA